jgi:hypothetical protein
LILGIKSIVLDHEIIFQSNSENFKSVQKKKILEFGFFRVGF